MSHSKISNLDESGFAREEAVFHAVERWMAGY
jgi:hypothetical protein